MSNKAVISLATGLEDPEKVTVAYLVAVGAAESGRPTLMFLTKEAVRLALAGTAIGVACDGCPPRFIDFQRSGQSGLLGSRGRQCCAAGVGGPTRFPRRKTKPINIWE